MDTVKNNLQTKIKMWNIPNIDQQNNNIENGSDNMYHLYYSK